jgi:hypothetical protein
METTQGNFLCSPLSQTSKNVMFPFLSFMFLSFIKSENKRTEQVLPRVGQGLLAPVGVERWQGKG